MAGWFTIDPNKLKQLAASTLINAQKRIDQVLDIKDGVPNPDSQSIVKNPITTSDDFFSTFLGNNPTDATPASTTTTTTTETITTDTPSELVNDPIPVEEDGSFSNWNAWTDQNQIIIPKNTSQTASDVPISMEEEKTSIVESIDSSSIVDSVVSHHHEQSASSIAESSTITESSSSGSGLSLQPTTSISSTPSTVIDPITEQTHHDQEKSSIDLDHQAVESPAEHPRDTFSKFPSDKRNVIDSWMNSGESSMAESRFEQSLQQFDESDSSAALYSSAYPPDEFPTRSIVFDEALTPTPMTNTNSMPLFNDEPQLVATVSTDEEEDNPIVEQSESPTHTVSSSNGHDTHSKGSSDDGKQASCASSDIEVISSPSVTSGVALSAGETFDKCRELRDARRPVVREVVVRFPTHSNNLKYHHQPLSMDNITQKTTSHFDTPSWSTLIDEAATEQNHYENSNDENEDEEHSDHRRKFPISDTDKEVHELKELLQSREQALKKLSDESNELHRTNQSLKQSLTQLEQRTSRLTNEFQQTIENLSMKIEEQKQVAQERDHLRKQLSALQRQLMESSTSSGNAMSVLREKEEQIQQLLEEGEKLSRTQLQHTNIIKKLRNKEKEHETQITSLNARIEKFTHELEEAKKTIHEKDENEKQLKESLKKFEKAATHYEKECLSLKSLYEDAEEQIRSTKVALENSYKEIAELNKTKAASESKVVEATLSAEILLREEIRLALDRERLLSRQEQEKLQMTIDELRHSIQRNDGQSSRKEQSLRQEINDLRQRLQEAESRNEELTQNISNATRPLLRQIENLQTTYVSQINSLERTERQLTDRLTEMQAQYATSVEHERVAQETLLETSTKYKLVEAQLSTLKQEKIRLTSELDILKIKLNNFEETRLREKSQIESMQEAFTQQINSLIQEKRQLEIDAELDKSKYESDLKRLQIVHDTLKEQHELFDSRTSINRTNSNLESTISQQRSRRPSGGGRDTPISFNFERTAFVSTPKPSVYDSLRNTGAIAVLESLESQLKEKEGEITLLQSEIADLERTRESMARELVNLSTANEKLQEQTRNYPILQEKFKDFEKRYDALLTMYGEKQEEADELRMDLADVKTLYRAQIDDLMKQAAQNR